MTTSLNNPLTIPDTIQSDLQVIRDHLLREADTSKPVVAGFVSSMQGEGATTVMLQLALSTLERGKSVLMVDASLDTGLSRILQKNVDPGLFELLSQKTLPEKVIYKTAIDGLTILPATSPLESLQMKISWPNILEGLRSHADFIFVDLPPVLGPSSQFNIYSACDGLVFIVAAHKTRKEIFLRAKNELEHIGDIKIFGAVLNGREYYIPDFLYPLI